MFACHYLGLTPNSSSTHGQNYTGSKATLFTNELVCLFLWPQTFCLYTLACVDRTRLCRVPPFPSLLGPLESPRFPSCPALCLPRVRHLQAGGAALPRAAARISVGRATTCPISLLLLHFLQQPTFMFFSLHIYPYICDSYRIMSLLFLFLVISPTAPPRRPQRKDNIHLTHDVKKKGQLPPFWY